MTEVRPLEFGWYLPTHGDTTAFNDADAFVPPSDELLGRVVGAAEAAGFEYMLIPVAPFCWEAYISGAFMAARSDRIRPLIAARPGYINPVLLAKMISTFDRLSGGRISINLIAGQAESEIEAEGVRYSKEERHALMAEEVAIMKALWAADGEPVDYDGGFHRLRGARVQPPTLQKPWPKFYLGGGSRDAWEMSAAHADVHLFWGDAPERIRGNICELRGLAAGHGRADAMGFGMRLQMLCREDEAEAWEVARILVARTTEADRARLRARVGSSEANRRVQELADTYGEFIVPNLWTGITRIRPGAGIAVVGNPEQCADVLQGFIDAGCDSFCLSGYLHDEEAERFGRLVRPLLAERNPDRMDGKGG